MGEEKKGKRFKVSTLVDGVLILLGVGLLAMEVSFMVSKQKDGIPSFFGKSVLRVLTGSMDGPDTPYFYLTRAGDVETGDVDGVYYTEEEAKKASGSDETVFLLKKNGPWMLGIDTGAILTKKDFSSVEIGDIVTFYYDIPDGYGNVYPNQLVSHRVIEKKGDVLYCYGDAYPGKGFAYSTSSSNYEGVQRVTQEKYVGTITSKSDFLGWFVMVSEQSWFAPVVVGVPLLTVAGFSLAETLKKSRAAKKEEERRIEELVLASGVDPKDEGAYEREREKARIKVEIQMEMEEEKEKQKEIYRRQFEKAKKEAMKELKEEGKK